VLIRPAHRSIDGGGLSGLACRSPGPARSTRKKVADVHCGIRLLPAFRVRVWEIMSRGWAHKRGDRWRRMLVLPTLTLSRSRRTVLCACGSSGGAACGAGVMAWERGAGAGERGRGVR